MKIAILYNQLVYPSVSHGGGIYLYNFISHFSKNHDIYLFCYYFKKEEPHINEIKSVVKYFYGIPIDENIPSLSRILFYVKHLLFSQYPIQNLVLYHENMKDEILRVLKTEEIDVLYFENIYMTHYLDFLPKNTNVLTYFRDDDLKYLALKENLNNVVLNLIQKSFKLRPSLYDLFLLFEHLQYRKYKKFERYLWNKIDFLSTSSDIERIIIKRITRRKDVYTFYHGINKMGVKTSIKSNHNVIFTGNYMHAPNQDAVLYFTSKIFPMIQKQVPDACFFIVGGNVPPIFHTLFDGNKSIKLFGYVNNINEIYEQCRVAVCPVRIGGGLRTKILEYMAFGLPVVSTIRGVEGFISLLNKEQHCYYSNDPTKIANFVIELLNNDTIYMEMQKKGFMFAQQFLWAKLFTNLENELSIQLKNKKLN